jgi:hypothetical protein
MLSLVVAAGVDGVFGDESTTDDCSVVPALAEAASALCWVLSVLAASVCLVVVEVAVAVGSPPMVVVPVIRWVISGFLGSTEMVTTTISWPFWP